MFFRKENGGLDHNTLKNQHTSSREIKNRKLASSPHVNWKLKCMVICLGIETKPNKMKRG
jgi:hypothetical protein